MTFEQALSIAHGYLNRRERTEHELRSHLLGRGASSSQADAAVQELAQQGYIDDARFASLFAQDKRDLNQWGRTRIQRELIQRGIAPDVAELALDQELPSDGGELQRALMLLKQRFPTLTPSRRERERALGLLLRRGYEYDVAIDALVAHTRAA